LDEQMPTVAQRVGNRISHPYLARPFVSADPPNGGSECSSIRPVLRDFGRRHVRRRLQVRDHRITLAD
jgi:hypothetical protein